MEKKTALIIDDGREVLAATPTEDIGKFVAASLANPASSHNKV